MAYGSDPEATGGYGQDRSATSNELMQTAAQDTARSMDPAQRAEVTTALKNPLATARGNVALGAFSAQAQDKFDQSQEAQYLEYAAANAHVPAPQLAKARQLWVAKPQYDIDYIVKNLPKIEQEVQAEKIPWDLVAQQHPVLAKYLKDPTTISQTLQDSASLTGIARWTGGNVTVLGPDGKPDTHYSPAPWMLGAKDAIINNTRAMFTKFGYSIFNADAKITEALRQQGVPDALLNTPEDLKDTKARWLAAAQRYERATTAAKDYRGFFDQDAASFGAKLARTAEWGAGVIAENSDFLAGGALGKATLGLGSFFRAYSVEKVFPEAMEGTGNPLKAAALTAVVAPAYAKVLEWTPAGTAVGARAESIIRNGVARAASDALSASNWPHLARSIVGKGGWDVLTGQIALAAQGATDAATSQLALAWGGKPTDEQAVARAFWGGLTNLDGIPLSLFGTAHTLVSDIGRMHRAQQMATSIERLRDDLLASKAATEDPTLHEQQVHEIANQPGHDPFFYLPLDRFNEEMQKNKLDPREVAKEIHGDYAAYDRATAEGAEHLTIPVEKMRKVFESKYLGDLAMSEGKLDPEVLSRAVAGKVMEEFNAALKEGTAVDPEKLGEEPVKDGFVRLYHGGAEPDGGARWVSQDRKYAEGYASKTAGAKVYYVDVPKADLEKHSHKVYDDAGLDREAPYGNFEAPPEIAKNLRPVDENEKGIYDALLAQGMDAKSALEHFAAIKALTGRHPQYTMQQIFDATWGPGGLWGPPRPAANEAVPGMHKEVKPEVEPLIKMLETESGLYNSREWMASFKDEQAKADLQQKEKAAQDEGRKRVAEALANGNRKQVQVERKMLEEQAHEEIQKDAGQRARHFFSDNELWGAKDRDDPRLLMMRDHITGKPLRLLDTEIRSLGFDPDQFAKGIVTKDSAKSMDIDMAANALGYEGSGASGEAARRMLAGLRDALPEREFVKQWADVKLRAAHGPALLDNPRALLTSIMDGVQNEKVVPALLSRLRAMREQLDPVRRARSVASGEDYAKFAGRIISDKSLRDLKPETFVRAAKAASERALKALEGGQWGRAFDATEAQILNHYLYRAAREMEGSVGAMYSKISERAASDAWRARIGKADPTYRRLFDALTGALGFGEPPPASPETDHVQEFIDQAKQNGQEVNLLNDQEGGWDSNVVRTLLTGGREWRDLKPYEAKQVFNAIQNIYHVAKEQHEGLKALRDGERASLIEGARRYLAGVKPGQEGPVRPGEDIQQSKDQEQAKLSDRWIFAQMWKDAYNETARLVLSRLGPEVKDKIDGGFLDAKVLEHKLLKDVYEGWKATQKIWEKDPEFHKAIAGLGDKLRLRDANGAPLQGDLAKKYVIQGLKWIGSMSGREKISKAFDMPADKFIEIVGQHVSQADMHAVQAEHDFFDQNLLPLKAAQFERQKGLPFPKVEATGYTIETRDGPVEMRGGYYPIHWDGRPGVEKQARPVEMERGPTLFPMVQNGSIKERTKFVGIPDLDWNNVPSHLLRDLHYIAFSDFVSDANRVLLDPRMLNNLRRYMGEEYASWPHNWLERVASESSGSISGHLADLGDAARLSRSAFITGAIGLNLPIFAAHMVHPLAVSAMRDGLGGVVNSARSMERVMESAATGLATGQDPLHEEIMAKSKYLPVYLSDLRENMGRWFKGSYDATSDTWVGKWDRAQDKAQMVGFWHLRVMTELVSKMIWDAKYNREMADHADEAKSIDAADEQVRAAMPNYNVMETPTILAEKHGVLSALLVFHTFWAKYREMFNEGKHDMIGMPFKQALAHEGSWGDVAWGTARFAGRASAMITFGIVAGELLKGQGKREDEDWGSWLIRRELTAPFKMFPYASDFFEKGVTDVVEGKSRIRDVELSNPFFAPIVRGINAVQHTMDVRRPTDENVAEVATAALMLGGFPAVAPVRAARYGYRVATGEEQPRGALDAAGGVIYSRRYGRSARYNEANPFTIMQDTAEESAK